jgi:Chaperone of endosialidase
MANKKVSQLTSKPSVLVTDLFPIADPSTGQLYKTTISDLGTAIGSGVSSVNGLVGAVVLDTDDIQELVSPTNKWFTDTRARAALSASSPLAYNSGTGVFSIPAATSSQNGYLTSTDWTTFNNKLSTATAASTYVPYTGATANVNLGQNYSLTAALIIKSGGTSTQFLKADGTIDTNTYALDSAVVKLTGNQTIAGVKTFTSGIVADVTTGGTQGFASTNSSASGSSIFLQNNSTSVGNAIGINNTSTADGIAIGNETSGRGIYISNATTSGSGKGISIDNYNGGIGIEVGSDSTADAIKILHLSGRAFNIQSSGGGYGVIINNTTASTSTPFTIQKQGANKITFTDAGAGTFVSTISAAGATLTGALSGTTANFSSLVSIIGTSADFILVRANNSNTANILFGTNNTYSWSAGLRNIENENFYIYNQTNSTNSVTINNSTNAVTLAGALSGTTITTTGNNIFNNSGGRAIDAVSTGVLFAQNGGAHNIIFGDGNVRYYSLFTPSGAAYGSIRNFSTSSDILTFTSAGNVGIGTSAPEVRLHIQAPNNLAALRLQNTAANKVWELNPSNPDVSNTGLTIWNVTDNTKPFHITDSGNVGIGTTSPSYKFVVSKGGAEGMEFDAGNIVAGKNYIINYNRSTSAYTDFQIDANSIIFGTAGSERMRITSGGLVEINRTSDLGNGILEIDGTSSRSAIACNQTATTTRYQIYFSNPNGIVGSISTNGSVTSYNITSDYRLKEDLKPINGLEIVNKIKVYDYKWKASDSRMDGVLAHELAEILPYAVNGVKDGEQMQGVDYSKIVPVMVQAIKDLKAELDTLKNK